MLAYPTNDHYEFQQVVFYLQETCQAKSVKGGHLEDFFNCLLLHLLVLFFTDLYKDCHDIKVHGANIAWFRGHIYAIDCQFYQFFSEHSLISKLTFYKVLQDNLRNRWAKCPETSA
jgi:hypothetical protein